MARFTHDDESREWWSETARLWALTAGLSLATWFAFCVQVDRSLIPLVPCALTVALLVDAWGRLWFFCPETKRSRLRLGALAAAFLVANWGLAQYGVDWERALPSSVAEVLKRYGPALSYLVGVAAETVYVLSVGATAEPLLLLRAAAAVVVIYQAFRGHQDGDLSWATAQALYSGAIILYFYGGPLPWWLTPDLRSNGTGAS